MILRVFPRRTMCTPDDIWVRIGCPGMFDPPPGTTAIYISIAFTWDIEQGALLYSQWSSLHPHVYIGGPAFGHPGDDFTPGMFLSEGNVITSRGCPGSCSYCVVPNREGPLRQLPIRNGWKVHDNNLLACTDEHIGFMPYAMLYRSLSWRADDPEWVKFRRQWIRPAIIRAHT